MTSPQPDGTPVVEHQAFADDAQAGPDTGLTVDEALAELDRAPAHLLAVEAQHGFVFGNPDGDKGDNAPPVAALVCSTPTCGQRNQHVQIHGDTTLPVHCGGCGTVLHCDHQPETTKVRAGTIGAPLEHTVTTCTVCRTELARDTAELPPIDLATLPVTLLDQPIG